MITSVLTPGKKTSIAKCNIAVNILREFRRFLHKVQVDEYSTNLDLFVSSYHKPRDNATKKHSRQNQLYFENPS